MQRPETWQAGGCNFLSLLCIKNAAPGKIEHEPQKTLVIYCSIFWGIAICMY